MLSFSKKNLIFVCTLQQNIFHSTGTNQLTISELRAEVTVQRAGFATLSSVDCKIYGVSLENMNDITTLMFSRNNLSKNTIEIFAVDDNQYQTLIFSGDIIQAFPVFNNLPNVYLQIEAQSAFYDSLTPYPVTSYKQSIDVATVIGKIAGDLGYHFENNGVTSRVNSPYLANSGIEQIKAIALAAGVDIYFDDKTIAISPPGIPRGNSNTVLSKESGMVGYPVYDGWGVDIYVLFNPSILWGSRVTVKSDYERANGTWVVTSMSHYLNSRSPDGAWFTEIRGTTEGNAITR